MGQHRRFPASFLLIALILVIPTIFFGLLRAAERADQCDAQAKIPAISATTPKRQ
jgi:hypothetical protein